jgi:hypothetical protein
VLPSSPMPRSRADFHSPGGAGAEVCSGGADSQDLSATDRSQLACASVRPVPGSSVPGLLDGLAHCTALIGNGPFCPVTRFVASPSERSQFATHRYPEVIPAASSVLSSGVRLETLV